MNFDLTPVLDLVRVQIERGVFYSGSSCEKFPRLTRHLHGSEFFVTRASRTPSPNRSRTVTQVSLSRHNRPLSYSFLPCSVRMHLPIILESRAACSGVKKNVPAKITSPEQSNRRWKFARLGKVPQANHKQTLEMSVLLGVNTNE